MGQRARRTLADQELAYARVRYLERFGRPIREQGESSHQAQSHFVAEEGTVERVIQAPRTRTQRTLL